MKNLLHTLELQPQERKASGSFVCTNNLVAI